MRTRLWLSAKLIKVQDCSFLEVLLLLTSSPSKVLIGLLASLAALLEVPQFELLLEDLS
jgi:hypothetical protein